MRKSLTFSALRASSTAKYSAKANLASSDGWNDSGPQRNQRTAPLMAGPTFNTTASMAMERNSRG